MPLISIKSSPLQITTSKPSQSPLTYTNSTAALIQRRRYQILVHSLLYYELDISLISDDEWVKRAQELVKLQKAHPDISAQVIFSEEFKNFDGSTGYHLPYKDEQIVQIAYRLLRSRGYKLDAERLAYIDTTPPHYTGGRYSEKRSINKGLFKKAGTGNR